MKACFTKLILGTLVFFDMDRSEIVGDSAVDRFGYHAVGFVGKVGFLWRLL